MNKARWMYLLLASGLTIGCGDSGGSSVDAGGDAHARRDGAGSDASGIQSDGPEALPDAGPAAGMQLSNVGGWALYASQDGNWVMFADSTNNSYAHIVSTNPSNHNKVDTTAKIAFQNDFEWISNTAIIQHDQDANNFVGGVAFWRSGYTAPVDLTLPLIGGTVDHPLVFALVSPDGLKVAYAKAVTGNNMAFDLKVRDLSTSNAPERMLFANVPAGNNCGIGGGWASPTTFLLLSCDPASTTSTDTQLRKIVDGGATTLLSGSDKIDGIMLSTSNNRDVDGNYVAYTTADNHALKVVRLTGAPGTITVETTGVTSSGTVQPLGQFHGNDLFYITNLGATGSGDLRKATISGTTKTVVTLVQNTQVSGWAHSSISGSAFSLNADRGVYFTTSGAGGEFGSMAMITTTGTSAVTPITLNQDNNGYPGDDAYSTTGQYIFWYDTVLADTNGIGKIHSRQFNGSNERVLDNTTYFIRQTPTEDLAAVMANTICPTCSGNTGTHIGDLYSYNVSTGTRRLLVDQITFMDMVPMMTNKVVYSRLDGIYITDFVAP